MPIGAFLIGVGAVRPSPAVLALLMVVADATIGQLRRRSGSSINDGAKELTVGRRPAAAGHAEDEGIFIPSACGGRGSCGLCKVTVHERRGRAAAHRAALAHRRGAGGQRPPLLPGQGQAGPRDRDPRGAVQRQAVPGPVASIRDLTHDIKEVRLRLWTRRPSISTPASTSSSRCPPTS